MKQIKIEVLKLLPVDADKKSKREVEYKAGQIDLGKEVSVLTLESIEFPGKFYVGDGHHVVLGYMELNQNPLITILENDDDLREALKNPRHGAINTTHFPTMRERIHNWHLDAVKHDIRDFYDLQKLIVDFDSLKI